MDNIEKLFMLAGARSKKKKPQKYHTPVENSWDEIHEYFVHQMGLGTTSKAFRLLQRIKFALEVEGYTFRSHDSSSNGFPADSTAPPASLGPPHLNKTTHVVSNGRLCTLMRSRPPAGLGIDAVIHLSQYLNSKQCYSFGIKPKDASRKRKTGTNSVLPKPVTWHRLQKHGLQIEKIFDENNNPIMESFRCDGVLAYSEDRKNFFVSNQERCRRWLEGVDRLVDLCEKR